MAQHSRTERVYADILPIARQVPAPGKYVIAIGGSRGKGLSDNQSDYDFRVYYENRVQGERWAEVSRELSQCIGKWKAQGVEIDGVWPRDMQKIEDELNLWLSGDGTEEPCVWSVWGYHLLTDIYNQIILEDPWGIGQAWKDRLSPYSDTLRASILRRYGDSLRYWRNDYHYRNKSVRGDAVFMASLSARLVHDMMEVIYALNRFYYPGDGHNLSFTDGFTVKPERLRERVLGILYPGRGPNCWAEQYQNALSLIDDVLALMDGPQSGR